MACIEVYVYSTPGLDALHTCVVIDLLRRHHTFASAMRRQHQCLRDDTASILAFVTEHVPAAAAFLTSAQLPFRLVVSPDGTARRG